MVYIYGKTDKQVGRLSDAEVAFLGNKGVTVIVGDGGHGDAIISFTEEELGKLIGSP